MSDQAGAVRHVGTGFSVRTTALSILAAAAIGAAVRAAEPILVPLLVSALLAYALEPLISALMRLRLPRVAAATIVFAVLLVAANAAVRSAMDRADALADELPITVEAIKHEIEARSSAVPAAQSSVISDVQRATAEIDALVHEASASTPGGPRKVTVVRQPVSAFAVLRGNGPTIATGVAYGVAVVFLTFLLAAAGDVPRRKLIRLGGQRLEQRKITLEVLKNIDRRIERYLAVRVLISGIVAALTALALWPIGLHHWLAWGVMAGVLNVMPFIGPSLAVAAIAVAAFLQFHTTGAVILAAGGATIVAVLEGNLLTPWLTSRAGELNTLSVFVGVLFWGWMWGVWGLVLAVPILVAIKAAADHIEPLQPIGELLGE